MITSRPNIGQLTGIQATDFYLMLPNPLVLDVKQVYTIPLIQTLGGYRDIVKCVFGIPLVKTQRQIMIKIIMIKMRYQGS